MGNSCAAGIGGYKTVIVKSPEQEIISIINKQIFHSISFSWETKPQHDKHYLTFRNFLKSFLPMRAERQFSENEARVAVVTSKKRIAILLEKEGRIKDAIDFVHQGLAIDPGGNFANIAG